MHGFFSRRGGVSVGIFAELNLSFGVGDAVDAVRENWRRVGCSMGADVGVASMRQVHGDQLVRVTAAGDAGEADGMVTAAGNVALSVLTADCVPLLLVATRARVVAAVHAGWRGTLAGIAPRAIEWLESTWGITPAQVSAALGPAIGGCCYEIERGIVDELEARWGALPRASTPRPNGKALLDLRRANTLLLRRAGVPEQQIVSVGPCTRCAADEYFSYRAAQAPTGRQLSFIAFAR